MKSCTACAGARRLPSGELCARCSGAGVLPFTREEWVDHLLTRPPGAAFTDVLTMAHLMGPEFNWEAWGAILQSAPRDVLIRAATKRRRKKETDER